MTRSINVIQPNEEQMSYGVNYGQGRYFVSFHINGKRTYFGTYGTIKQANRIARHVIHQLKLSKHKRTRQNYSYNTTEHRAKYLEMIKSLKITKSRHGRPKVKVDERISKLKIELGIN